MACEHFNKNKNKCKITGYDITSNEAITYCMNHAKQCFINGGYKLKANEYTYNFQPDEKPIAGKIFVDNAGVKFECVTDGIILCPLCAEQLHIISFKFGIFCPNCGKNIH